MTLRKTLYLFLEIIFIVPYEINLLEKLNRAEDIP